MPVPVTVASQAAFTEVQSPATPGRVQLDVAGSHWHGPAISESQRPRHRNVARRLISIWWLDSGVECQWRAPGCAGGSRPGISESTF